MSRTSTVFIGQRFTRLVVLQRDPARSSKNAFWTCQCDCGRITSVSSPDLRQNHTKSCGCLAREQKKYLSRAEMMRAGQRRWQRKNQQRLTASNRARRLANYALSLAKEAAYREAHREQERVRLALYKKTHREQDRFNCARRRARQRAAPVNDLTLAQWRGIQQAYHYCCAYCGIKPTCLTMDHIVPIAKGGSHTSNNIVPACKSCNSRKWLHAPCIPLQLCLV